MPTYRIIIKREAGNDPLTNAFLEEAQEELFVEAHTEDEAVKKSSTMSKLKFIGQVRRTYVNGEEYFNPRF